MVKILELARPVVQDCRSFFCTYARARVCVCVCVLPIYFGDSSSDQGETCASLCSVFRELHLQRFFSVPRSQPGWGRTLCSLKFSLLFWIFLNAPPPPAVFACMFLSREGSSHPFPRRQSSRICQLTKLFSPSPLSTTSYKSEEKHIHSRRDSNPQTGCYV